jgi:hypothetical protein
MPPEVYPLYGPKIERKLIRRRNGLQKDAMRYYRFLASDVVVNGTAANDHFVIRRTRDSVTVQQFAGADATQLLYSRTFHRRETFRVTLVGLDGADTFTDSSAGTSRINVVIDGGTGANTLSCKARPQPTLFRFPIGCQSLPAYFKGTIAHQRVRFRLLRFATFSKAHKALRCCIVLQQWQM